MQLSLLDTEKNETMAPRKISWSPSKVSLLKQCSRKYYFQYYGSKKNKAKSDPNKIRLQLLAEFSNINQVAGDITHIVIATFFRKSHQQDLWNLEQLKSFATHILKQYLDYSRKKRLDSSHNIEYPTPILKEVFYNQVSEKSILEEIKSMVDLNLKSFFESDIFSQLKLGGQKRSALVEEKISFPLNDFLRVEGIIDLAFNNDKIFHIADWKTGKASSEETSLQLLTYAMWAIQEEYSKKDSIQMCKAFVSENRLEPLEFSNLHLERAKTRIIQDAEIFVELNEFGIEGNSSAFTKCDKLKVCKLCQYEEICQSTNN